MVVEDIMSPNPIVVPVTASVRRARAILLEADVRHLPVVDEGKLVGIVSDRDFRSLEFEPGDAGEPLDRPLSALMSSDVITVHPETDLGDVIDLLIEHRIGAIPVVHPDSLKLLGIVSYIDVLRVAREAVG